MLLSGLCLLAAAAGCQRDAAIPVEPAAEPPMASAPASPGTPDIPAAPDIPGDVVTASYGCEGNRVDLVQTETIARITMSDGRLARLGEMARSSPRTWRDVGLAFTLYPNGPVLEQEDGPLLECEPLESASTG